MLGPLRKHPTDWRQLRHKHLTAEHHDLDVLVRLGAPRGSEQAEATEAEATADHGPGGEHCQLRAAIEVFVPNTSGNSNLAALVERGAGCDRLETFALS
jgi:hypothetical protein